MYDITHGVNELGVKKFRLLRVKKQLEIFLILRFTYKDIWLYGVYQNHIILKEDCSKKGN